MCPVHDSRGDRHLQHVDCESCEYLMTSHTPCGHKEGGISRTTATEIYLFVDINYTQVLVREIDILLH